MSCILSYDIIITIWCDIWFKYNIYLASIVFYSKYCSLLATHFSMLLVICGYLHNFRCPAFAYETVIADGETLPIVKCL